MLSQCVHFSTMNSEYITFFQVPNCQNHITFITRTREDIPEFFLCGTNALSPQGYKLRKDNDQYSLLPKGSAACSDDPFNNITAIFICKLWKEEKKTMHFCSTLVFEIFVLEFHCPFQCYKIHYGSNLIQHFKPKTIISYLFSMYG